MAFPHQRAIVDGKPQEDADKRQDEAVQRLSCDYGGDGLQSDASEKQAGDQHKAPGEFEKQAGFRPFDLVPVFKQIAGR